MSGSEPPADPSADEESRRSALAANEAFYQAIAARDLAAMAALWVERAPAVCIHPGWPPLVGRDHVLESWQNILSARTAPRIRCAEPRALAYGPAVLVVCRELVSGAGLSAANLFVAEDGAWRLAHHQASLLATEETPARNRGEPRRVLH